MTSLKKIAFALVAATALATSVIATPASAAVSTALTVGGNAAVGGTAVSAPVALPVPADNSVDAVDALKIALTGLDTGTTVSAVVTNGKIVTALAAVNAPVSASAGVSNVSINTGTGTTADIYVFTTTTAVGTVAVTVGGNTTTYYFQGTAGALNAIELAGATSGAAGTTYTASVRGVDVFGNAKGGASISLQVVTNTASTVYALTTDTATATLGTKTQDITLPAAGTVRLIATATVASAVTGLATPVAVRVADVTVRDLASELTAKTAELTVAQAALAAEKVAHDATKAELAKVKAELALEQAKAIAEAKNTASAKAKYNALATKWNKKFPKTKVALLK
jgi:hypothetical protein